MEPDCTPRFSATRAPWDRSSSKSKAGSLLSSALLKEMVVSRTARHTSNAINPKELNALVQIDSTAAHLADTGIHRDTELTPAYRPHTGLR
jgi:hypothetical protein